MANEGSSLAVELTTVGVGPEVRVLENVAQTSVIKHVLGGLGGERRGKCIRCRCLFPETGNGNLSMSKT